MKITSNNLLIGIVAVLFGYIIFNYIFSETVDPNVELKTKVELLEHNNKILDNEIAESSRKVIIFKNISDSLRVQDSIKNSEILVYKESEVKLKVKLGKIYRQRNIIQKELEYLKGNPIVIKNDIDLIRNVKNNLEK